MNPLTPPNRRRFGAIQSESALKGSRRISLATMDKWCELERPGQSGVGGGMAGDTPPVRAGRVRCAIGQGTRGEETQRPVQANESGFEWEFLLPLGTAIGPKWRLAWPAFFPTWTPGTVWEKGQIVAPAGWIMGTAAFMRCVTPGLGGNDEPAWPELVEHTVPDGAALWLLMGWVTLFEVVAVARSQSNTAQLVVRTKEI